MKKIEMIGLVFGRLTVVAEAPWRDGRAYWQCRCSCGNHITVVGKSLRSGNTQSCGCYQKQRASEANVVHGHAMRTGEHPLFTVWMGMHSRCNNKNNPRYGGRGITVCEAWSDYQQFYADMAPTWVPGLTLERKDNALGYSKENCTWATYAEQNRNQRTNRYYEYDGKRMILADWEKETGIKRLTLRYRLEAGWPLADVFSKEKVPYHMK